jgi:hypothetical protein
MLSVDRAHSYSADEGQAIVAANLGDSSNDESSHGPTRLSRVDVQEDGWHMDTEFLCGL